MRKLNEIIVHCSATPEGRHVTMETIRKWHKARGWSREGYHFAIYLDGTRVAGRPVSMKGAGVAGRNTGTIHIVYIGGVAKDGRTPKDTRTPAQKAALERLIGDLCRDYPSINQVSGHNQYAAKACPSFDASTCYDRLIVAKPSKRAPKPAQANSRYKYLQKLLASTGRSFGQIDGIEGPKTQRAIEDYQEFMGLPVTGKFDPATVKALRAVEQGNMSDGTKEFLTKVAAKGRGSNTKKAALLGGTVSLTGIGAQVSEAINVADTLTENIINVGPWVLLIVIAAGAAWYIYTQRSGYEQGADELLAEADV